LITADELLREHLNVRVVRLELAYERKVAGGVSGLGPQILVFGHTACCYAVDCTTCSGAAAEAITAGGDYFVHLALLTPQIQQAKEHDAQLLPGSSRFAASTRKHPIMDEECADKQARIAVPGDENLPVACLRGSLRI
jgi:hypothetical protein